MRGITVRFDAVQLRFIAAQAKRQDVSAAQFIRDAAFGRAVLQWGANADPQELAAVLGVLAGQSSPGEADVILKRIVPSLYPDDDGGGV